MTRCLLLCLIPIVAVTQPPAADIKPEDRCTIEGRVLNEATGEPVKRANLVLRRADVTPSATVPFPPSYSTSTDAAGKFAMKDIEPGKYQLSVNRNGFINLSYGARGPGRPGTTLSLDRAQQLKDLVFRMTPHGVIAGRVIDEDGEPVAYAQLQAMRYRYLQGRKQLIPSGGAMTNDLGEYRIFGLAPGRYYLNAVARNPMQFETSVDRSAAPPPEENYVPTYYPGTTDASAAATLDIAAGNVLRGIDFTLSRSRTVRIRGRIVNTSGAAPRNISVMLSPRDRGYFMPGNRTMVNDPGGIFEMRGVAPGAYNLVATIYDGERSASGRQAVDVGSSNLENVVITIGPGIDVTGRTRVEDNTPASLSNLRVMLRPSDPGAIMFGGSGDGRVKDDGAFTLTRINPDRYTVTVMGLPDGFYVKSIRSGDEDALLPGLDLTRGAGAPIDIVLSPGAGRVEGTVQKDQQQPAAAATVVLIPDDEKRRERLELIKTFSTDQYGRFTIKNVEPGQYKAYAWEDIEYGAYMDPDVLKQAEGKGESVTVREKSVETLQLKLIPAKSGQDSVPGPSA